MRSHPCSCNLEALTGVRASTQKHKGAICSQLKIGTRENKSGTTHHPEFKEGQSATPPRSKKLEARPDTGSTRSSNTGEKHSVAGQNFRISQCRLARFPVGKVKNHLVDNN